MRFAAPVPALALALLARPAVAQTFDFDTTPDRVWLGREFWANRLQDWRVPGQRLECVETRKNLPMRTAQLLTAALGETPGQAEISVKLGQSMASPHAQQADSYTLVVQLVRGATVARVTPRTQNDAGDVLHFAFAEVGHALADGSVARAPAEGPWDWEYRHEATGEVLRSEGSGATRDVDRLACRERADR